MVVEHSHSFGALEIIGSLVDVTELTPYYPEVVSGVLNQHTSTTLHLNQPCDHLQLVDTLAGFQTLDGLLQ